MFRRCRPGAICAIALGAGILLSLILPTGLVLVLGALALIALGVTWLLC